MNNVSLIGRLTRDLEVMTTQNGNSYVRFTVAINRIGTAKDQTDFISCTAWNATAENMAKYIGKGSQVGVEGRITSSTYEKNGQTVYNQEVTANRVSFLDSKGTRTNDSSTQASNNAAPVKEVVTPTEESIDDFFSGE